MTFESKDEPIVSTRSGVGRRPSGARAAPANRAVNVGDRLSSTVSEEEESDASSPSQGITQRITMSPAEENAEHLDALAALSYLDIGEQAPPASPSPVTRQKLVSPPPPASPQIVEPSTTSTPSENGQFRSSFAPSKQASERKAKAQAQQAAHQVATHKPGKAGRGASKPKAPKQGWAESSEEEDDDEEEGDDDEDDSDDSQPKKAPSLQRGIGASPNGSTTEITTPGPSHVRPPRTLPQIPGGRLGVEADEYSQRRMIPDQFSDRRTQYDDGPQIRLQSEAPLPGAARQTMWSQVLDPGRKVEPTGPDNSKFVQLEDSAQMTKAFTPHGLLSAGLQDKQDRSAKRQEELARESGASLVNVPNKPPPPQSGLLGAITAHERDRKREGGMGAMLTEREREKRMAEERQRRFDEMQRQQMDQMQQGGGSMYGGQFGFNPMMNPMMMGMNPMMPMMTGGPMSPMMTGYGGFNPQHMFAAQQAAQAYQQAMMAFSVAGSQAGGEMGGQQQPQQQQQMLNPMMSGGMSFDPRMTMMGGMPMMGGPMMNPMGMQMTGMSTFDPRFSPSNNTPNSGGELPSNGNGAFAAQFQGSQGAFSNSPVTSSTPQTGTPNDTRPSSPKV